MDSTTSTTGLQEQLPPLIEVMGDFAGGAVSLHELCDAICNELHEDRSRGADIQSILDKELKARRLSVKDYKELVEGINASLRGEPVHRSDEDAPSENIPTEASEGVPDTPGRYHVDHEGTLVLDEEEDLPAPRALPTEAYDATAEEPVEELPPVGVGSVLRERFQLDEEIARGSMGIVYRATDLLKKDAGAKSPFVAVKLISPEFVSHGTALKTFQNEIANTQHLSHPNIIHLFELDRDGDHYFITMEWLEGESLDALLDRSRGSALPPTQTYAIIEQLCDALAYAHERDVIHADVKPGNVFLIKTGELKLIDFGIAQIEKPGEEGGDSGTVALTPAYASCERLERAKPTAQDDLFSLACMIYRLLSGRRVFDSMNALEAEKAAVQPVPIGGMNDARWNALKKALSFRRADRQASVAEFAAEFGQRKVQRDIEPEPEPVEEEPGHTETKTIESLPDKEEPRHTETKSMESLPDDVLISDSLLLEEIAATTRREALNETSELSALVGTSEHMHIDTTIMEPLNETAELQALPGANELRNTVMPVEPEPEPTAVPSASDLEKALADGGGETTRIEELNETAKLHSMAGSAEPTGPSTVSPEAQPPARASANSMHIDTARLEAMPDFGFADDLKPPADAEENQPAPPGTEQPFADTVNLDGEEKPFTDTVNLDGAPVPEPINILDGDGAGLAPAADPAASVSVPADDVVAKAPKPPKPKPKLPPKPKADGESVTDVRHREKVTAQLRGGGQRQVSAGNNFIDKLKQPKVAGGAAIALIAGMIGLGVMLSGGESDPVVTNAVSPEQKVAVAPETAADPTSNEPIMMDLSAPVEAAPDASDGMKSVDLSVAQPVEPVKPAPAESMPVKSKQLQAVAPKATSSAIKPAVAKPKAASPAIKPEVTKPVADLALAPVVADPLAAKVAAEPVPASSTREIPFAEPELVASPKVDPAQEQYLAGLQAKVEQALNRDRLLEPAEDNAAYWIAQMDEGGADEPTLNVLSKELATKFISRGEEAYIQGDIKAATRWADEAERFGAAELELEPLRASIRKFSASQPVTKTTVPTEASVPAGPPQTTQAELNEAARVRFDTVAMADLKFVKFIEPEYPKRGLAMGANGWVDVAFTIDKNGETQNIVVTDTDLPERFRISATSAVKRWRFEPYVQGGRPLVVNSSVRLRFEY